MEKIYFAVTTDKLDAGLILRDMRNPNYLYSEKLNCYICFNARYRLNVSDKGFTFYFEEIPSSKGENK